MTKDTHACTVRVTADSELPNKILEWCKNNCASYVTNSAAADGKMYFYSFYISDLSERALFKLKWSEYIYE